MHDQINPEVVKLVSYNIYIFSEEECLCFFICNLTLDKQNSREKSTKILLRIFNHTLISKVSNVNRKYKGNYYFSMKQNLTSTFCFFTNKAFCNFSQDGEQII